MRTHWKFLWAGFFACLLITCTWSAPSVAWVEKVQAPSWLVQADGQKTALYPGLQLKMGDRIETGPQARVMLLLAEGSAIKLGENTQFDLTWVRPAEGKEGVFGGTLNILKGAFRFTTDSLHKLINRNIEVKVASVTVGIRGTDLWGKSTDEKDVVCLIEGHVDVTPDIGAPVELDHALDFFSAPKGKAGEKNVIPLEKLEQWSAETEPNSLLPVRSTEGKWTVYAGAYSNADTANALQAALDTAGWSSDVTQVKYQGKHVNLVQLTGFVSEADANLASEGLKSLYAELKPEIMNR